MDANKKKATHLLVKETVAALEKNNFNATFVNTKEEALTLIKTMIQEGSYTAMGGSMTLEDSGIAEYIRSCTDFHKDYRDAYRAQWYLMSSNAITSRGEIYNVDGTSNRVSAMLYGPEKVVIVVGVNKLVRTLQDAVERVKCAAAPANAIRLCRDTPCTKLGHCISPEPTLEEVGGCKAEECICCNAVTMRRTRFKERYTVIIVGEELGY